MEPLFENRTVYSKEVLREAFKAYVWKKQRILNTLCIILGCIMLLLSVVMVVVTKTVPQIGFLVALVVLVVAIVTVVFFGSRFAADKTYKANVTAGLPLEMFYIFTQQGFTVQNVQGNASIGWQQCSLHIFSQNLCLLVSGMNFYAVDMRGFTKGAPQQFEGFIRQVTPAK